MNILAQPKRSLIKQNITLVLTCLLWLGVLIVAYQHFFADDSSAVSGSSMAGEPIQTAQSTVTATGNVAGGATSAVTNAAAGQDASNASRSVNGANAQRKPQRIASLPANDNLRQQIVSASPNPAEADAAIAAVQSLRIATLLARRDKILAERAKYQHDAQQWRDKTAALGKQSSGNSAFQAAATSGGGASLSASGEQNVDDDRVNIDDISLRAIVKDGKGYRASFSIEGKNSVSGRNGGVLTQGIRIKSIASDRAVLVSGAENRTLYAY